MATATTGPGRGVEGANELANTSRATAPAAIPANGAATALENEALGDAVVDDAVLAGGAPGVGSTIDSMME
ncbi:MAG: hypothetical protein R2706_10815 [Acidimicrobiales bacterium]